MVELDDDEEDEADELLVLVLIVEPGTLDVEPLIALDVAFAFVGDPLGA